MKRINRIFMELTEDDVAKIENCEDLHKVAKGCIDNDVEYDIGIISNKEEAFFYVDLILKDGTYTIHSDLNSMLYMPLTFIKFSSDLNVLATIKIPNYKERYSLNKCKLRTNYGCNNKLEQNYVYSLILNNSFVDETEFCEVLFLYLNLNHNDDDIYKVDSLLNEKLEYYGYYKENFEDYVDEFKDEYLGKIFYNALNLLYMGKTPTLNGDDLRTWYNRFQHNRIKERFSAMF